MAPTLSSCLQCSSPLEPQVQGVDYCSPCFLAHLRGTAPPPVTCLSTVQSNMENYSPSPERINNNFLKVDNDGQDAIVDTPKVEKIKLYKEQNRKSQELAVKVKHKNGNKDSMQQVKSDNKYLVQEQEQVQSAKMVDQKHEAKWEQFKVGKSRISNKMKIALGETEYPKKGVSLFSKDFKDAESFEPTKIKMIKKNKEHSQAEIDDMLLEQQGDFASVEAKAASSLVTDIKEVCQMESISEKHNVIKCETETETKSMSRKKKRVVFPTLMEKKKTAMSDNNHKDNMKAAGAEVQKMMAKRLLEPDHKDEQEQQGHCPTRPRRSALLLARLLIKPGGIK